MANPPKKSPPREKPDMMGVTLIMEAAKHNVISKIVECIEAKHNINAVDDAGFTALLHAVTAGHEEAALMLLFHKADMTIANRAGWTALHVAAEKKLDQVVERWATLKGPLDDQEKIDGHTPLMKAILADDIWAAVRLVDAGADFSKLKDKKGQTAETMARSFDAKDREYFKAAITRRHEADAARDKKFHEDLRRAAGPLQKGIPAPESAKFRKKDRGPVA
jgi:hypothetical protein